MFMTLCLVCCAVLCCAVLCCAVLCCAVLCCTVLCCAVLYCAVLCYAVLWCCCMNDKNSMKMYCPLEIAFLLSALKAPIGC